MTLEFHGSQVLATKHTGCNDAQMKAGNPVQASKQASKPTLLYKRKRLLNFQRISPPKDIELLCNQASSLSEAAL